jgi:hypothetical protein
VGVSTCCLDFSYVKGFVVSCVEGFSCFKCEGYCCLQLWRVLSIESLVVAFCGAFCCLNSVVYLLFCLLCGQHPFGGLYFGKTVFQSILIEIKP